VDTFLAQAFLVEKIQLEQEYDVCHAFWIVYQNQEQYVPTLVLSETLHSTLPNFHTIYSVFWEFLIQKF